ncbi:VIT1/CCC1 family protein, partial [Chloroflexota bacterium]
EHHNIWKKHTDRAVKPYRFKIWLYHLISRIFGITFAIKLMENGEEGAQLNYDDIARFVPDAKAIMDDEHQHEQELIALIDEERLRYTGAIIRGLNEALVELTGALSGLTFAFQSEDLIAAVGIITGLVMSLSLAGTEYLATKAEDGHQRPWKAAVYTGFANLVTVLFLVFPYLLPINVFASLGWMITNAIITIYIFNYYISVARETSMRKGFFEMAFISLGIASIAFVIGFLARTLWHIEI